MQSVTVRPANSGDIPDMARLWYENTVLQHQFDRRFAMLPDGQSRWMAEASNWLNDESCLMCVAERGDEMVGYIVAWIQPGPPGMTPERLGVVTQLVMDAHGQQGGVGRLLLQPVRDWLAAHRISYVVAYVPRRQAVEQAFWRALGATEWLDALWMKL